MQRPWNVCRRRCGKNWKKSSSWGLSMKKTTGIGCAIILCCALLLTCAVGQTRGRRPRPGRTRPGSTESRTEPASKPSNADEPSKGDTATSDAETTDTTKSEATTEKPAEDKAEAKPEAKDKKDEGVSVAFKDMTVDKICSFLSEHLKKPVIPSESIKAKKITIIAKEKMPLEKAIHLVRQALLGEEIMVEQLPDVIRVRPVSEVMQTMLRRVPAGESVASIEDDLQIVTKEFLIDYYSVENMEKLIQPMLASFGHIITDPNTRKLLITDTVGNLLRIEQIIASMDVPLAEKNLVEVFKLQHGDATEIVAILRWLISGRMGIHVKEITTSGGGEAKQDSGRPSGPSRGRPPSPRGPSGSGAATGITQITPSEAAVTLVPHISRNWIIAIAPAEIMGQIRIWVEEYDQPREVEKDYELYDVKYADTNELAQQIQQAFQAMPSELSESTEVVAFGESDKLIVFGPPRGREMAKKLLEEIDIEDVDKRIRKTFKLEHADAEEMGQRIETLFSEMEVAGRSSYYRSSYTYYRRSEEAKKVTVVADTRRNMITVITDSDTMKEIEALIAEEDIAIDPGEVAPRIYELQYTDPGEIRDLLMDMFGGREPQRRSIWDYYFGGGGDTEYKPIGRLLGEFSFQVMPSSNKLLVQAKNRANLVVIDKLIEQLDLPQRAGLPLFIELKYANAEDLCEQLNALLAEPGELAKIRRAARGLTDYIGRSDETGSESSSRSDETDSEDDSEMTEFWWQGYRRPEDQVPLSNLIGKIRFVPVYQRNAVMVLAPTGFAEPIRELIDELDQRGRQVIIYGRIGEIQHNDQTSLGIRIASDPSILPPADTAVGGNMSLTFSETVLSGTLTLGAGANVTMLLNLLIEEYGMKILAEPSLTTSDNEAAEFFDGQELSVIGELRDSAEGGSTVTSVQDKTVGTRLRIRPHITKEGSVDMMIHLEISRIVPGATSAGGNPIIDRREVVTHVIVQNGQTVMLSGIIQQEKFDDIRKTPLLGDLPLIGPLFRAVDKGIRNREIVVFITPRVMTGPEEVDEEMKKPLGTLEQIEKSMNPSGKEKK